MSRISSSGSPAAPNLLSMKGEKEQMELLNNRLAQYIDRMRSLEKENLWLKRQKVAVEESSLKRGEQEDAYKRELALIQSNVTKLSDENQSLKIEYRDAANAHQNMCGRLKETEIRNSAAQKRIFDLNHQIGELSSSNSTLLRIGDRAENELKDCLEDVASVSSSLESTRCLIEDENLLKGEAVRAIKGLQEELAAKEKLFQKERDTTVSALVAATSATSGDSRAKELENEDKIATALTEARRESNRLIEDDKMKCQAANEPKIRKLERKLVEEEKMISKTRCEEETIRTDMEVIEANIETVRCEVKVLSANVSKLEVGIEAEKEGGRKIVDAANHEITNLRLEINQQLDKYKDLNDVTTALDNQISDYRKLMDSEDHRMTSSEMLSSGGDDLAPPSKCLKISRSTEELTELLVVKNEEKNNDVAVYSNGDINHNCQVLSKIKIGGGGGGDK